MGGFVGSVDGIRGADRISMCFCMALSEVLGHSCSESKKMPKKPINPNQ